MQAQRMASVGGRGRTVGEREDLVVLDVDDLAAVGDLGVAVALGDLSDVHWQVGRGARQLAASGGREERRNGVRTAAAVRGLGDKQEIALVIAAALDRAEVGRAGLAERDALPRHGRARRDEDLVACREKRRKRSARERKDDGREEGARAGALFLITSFSR